MEQAAGGTRSLRSQVRSGLWLDAGIVVARIRADSSLVTKVRSVHFC